ncbi:hypothetical protein OK016_15120 [Vibrio chagasii]|nr:hypothetical protein [Vibrio chagasii]
MKGVAPQQAMQTNSTYKADHHCDGEGAKSKSSILITIQFVTPAPVKERL